MFKILECQKKRKKNQQISGYYKKLYMYLCQKMSVETLCVCVCVCVCVDALKQKCWMLPRDLIWEKVAPYDKRMKNT